MTLALEIITLVLGAVAMVFVLLTYGGWNEAAYLSAEMRGGHRVIVGTLVAGRLDDYQARLAERAFGVFKLLI